MPVAAVVLVGNLGHNDDTAVVTALDGRVEGGEGGASLGDDEALSLDTVGFEAGGTVGDIVVVTTDDEDGTGDGLGAGVGYSRLEGEKRADGALEETHRLGLCLFFFLEIFS